MEHFFPLQAPPRCRKPQCGQPCTRKITTGNKNGNAGRPYYDCEAGHASKFACFDDLVGLDPRHPACECRMPSRLNNIRTGSFYSCAVGSCGWTKTADWTAQSVELPDMSPAVRYAEMWTPPPESPPEPVKTGYTVRNTEMWSTGVEKRRGGLSCCVVM